MKSNIFQCLFQKNMKVLPTPHWKSKMYNLTVGIRILIECKQCVIKPLSQNITAVLTLLSVIFLL